MLSHKSSFPFQEHDDSFLAMFSSCFVINALQKKSDKKLKKEKEDADEKEKDMDQKEDKETKSLDEKSEKRKEDSSAVTEVVVMLLSAFSSVT